MSDILTTILARKAEEIAERSARVPLADLRARIAEASPTRGFADALHAMIAQGDPAVIAAQLEPGMISQLVAAIRSACAKMSA